MRQGERESGATIASLAVWQGKREGGATVASFTRLPEGTVGQPFYGWFIESKVSR